MLTRLIGIILLFSTSHALAERHEHTSMMKLFASASDYQDKLVSIAGVLGRGRGDNNYVLYFDLGSQQNEVRINSLTVTLNPDSLKSDELKLLVGKYVLAFGVFRSKTLKGIESGILQNVTRVGVYPLFSD